MLTAAALVLFTLLCITLSDDLAWDNVTRSTRNELVFQDRHRGYGAFVLRREYDRRFVIAFLGALGLLGGGIGAAYVLAPMVLTDTGRPPHVTEWTIDPTVFEAPKASPEKKSASAPAPRPAPPTNPATLPGFVEAGSKSDSAKMDPQPRVDTLDLSAGKGPGTGPVEPGGGGKPGDDGSSLGTLENPENPSGVDSLPRFPGGDTRMFDFVQRNIVFPEAEGGKQKVFVEFIVDVDGTVRSVIARGKRRTAYDEAAERVVKRMPQWEPALRKGKKVACRLVLPISFETH